VRLIAILKKGMAAKLFNLLLIFFFIKSSTLKTATIKDVHMNKKFSCEEVSKYTLSVKSQIQCAHICLRKNCTLVNYNTETTFENCEVLSYTSACSIVLWQKNWLAITVQPKETTTGLGYIGCYKDGGQRALPSPQSLQKSLGTFTEQCINKCRSLNYPYAGLQYYYQCFCGEEYDKYGKADESLCNYLCRDSSGSFCGGSWKNSVYKT